MPDVSQLLQTAVGLHRGGQLDQARQIYQQILAQDPRHANALNLLGLIGWQTGRFTEAVEHLLQAIAIDGTQAAFFGNLAEARRGLGQIDEAVECYVKAAKLQPQAAIVPLNLGTLLEHAGRYDQAVAAYTRAIELAPQDVRPQYHLASTLEKQGKLAEAAARYERALAIDAGHLASVLGLATTRQKQGDFAAAATLHQRAVQAEPTRPERHFDLANALQYGRQFAEAIASYRKAIDLDPNYADAYCNLGNALREHGQLAEALTCAQRAVELRAESAPAQSNLGVVLQDSGRLAEAQQRFERAIELDPLRAEFALNLGTVLRDQGHAAEALDQFERALQLQPDYAQALCSRGMALLSLGRFRPGWQGYEHRIGLPQFDTATFPQPRWDGGPLAGRTLLIHCEQGLGDTLQFIRYVKLARERAGDGRVIVAAQTALLPLLSQSGFAELVPNDRPLPPFDVQVPLMSLPLVFGTEVETVPRDVPYLAADKTRVEHWRHALAKYPGRRIGIAWQGRPSFRGDLLRSTPLQSFAPLADVSGARLISLQKGPGVDQLAGLAGRFEVVDLGDALDREGAFLDTASVMSHLDLVVTTDSAIAHLAGALGVRVWVALAIGPDWRWMVEREDSPWYPTMRLFRQTQVGQWSDVFTRIAEAVPGGFS